MSVKVDLDKLADALADFSFGYLITVGDDFRAHTVAVEPVLTEGVFEVGQMGSGTRRNADEHPDVTVIWPPAEPGGYMLIVDGRAVVTDDRVTVTPTKAILHRRATSESAATSPDGLHDCLPLKE
ncbi:pyridoxamine 5'-phosphate oxidase family protein [Mycolicibacterium gadium]|uniref:Pyridoxamine 5'-phosphate oxidase family protein n=1 Tax=Mycolicibacterium gadium TaxID=1794 RepID=A0ABT6GZM5_MYCGU|nr:pyridoxamine 5'-phosphate oxidase family protein [Mycolicibacterium gadium]MDG5486599.1 pyridoxamine 5'-phosphate oxidase family protein [Mycolicibacterium gadium]